MRKCLRLKAKFSNLTNEELGMGYRTSVIAKNDYVALSAVLKLEKGDRQEIRAYMEDLKERRVTKQPLEFGSAGSTFKRPEGYFAGKLIQDSGMQGYRVGDAQVSGKTLRICYQQRKCYGSGSHAVDERCCG